MLVGVVISEFGATLVFGGGCALVFGCFGLQRVAFVAGVCCGWSVWASLLC